MNEEMLAGTEEYVEGMLPPAETANALALALDLPTDFSPPAPLDDRDFIKTVATNNPWSASLVFDVAMDLDPLTTILERHGLTLLQWAHIHTHPLFLRQVAEHAREIGENGVSFRAKAKIQAEMYLLEVDKIVTDPTTDKKVRLEAIRSTVKWAALEPVVNKEEGSGVPQVNVQINLG